MPQLVLNDDETRLLAGALRSYLSELHTEITSTDGLEMREELKRQEVVLRGIQRQLDAPPPA